MGSSKRAFRRSADQLVDLIDRFMAVAWPEDLPVDGDADLHVYLTGSAPDVPAQVPADQHGVSEPFPPGSS